MTSHAFQFHILHIWYISQIASTFKDTKLKHLVRPSHVRSLKCWSTCEIQNVHEAGRIVSWKPKPDVVYFCFCSSEQTRIYLGANKRKAWSANIHRTKNFQKFQSPSRRFFCLWDRILNVSFEKYPIKSNTDCPINEMIIGFISNRFQRTRARTRHWTKRGMVAPELI